MSFFLRLPCPALFLALGLAACSPDAGDDPAEGKVGKTAIPVEPGRGIGDGAGPPAAASSTRVSDTIPERFLGVWDHAEGSCMPASDLRMDIRPREIEFYESLGRVTQVTVENPDTILLELDMAGEGETWTVESRYVLSEGGTILTPLETEENARYTPIARKRCDD